MALRIILTYVTECARIRCCISNHRGVPVSCGGFEIPRYDTLEISLGRVMLTRSFRTNILPICSPLDQTSTLFELLVSASFVIAHMGDARLLRVEISHSFCSSRVWSNNPYFANLSRRSTKLLIGSKKWLACAAIRSNSSLRPIHRLLVRGRTSFYAQPGTTFSWTAFLHTTGIARAFHPFHHCANMTADGKAYMGNGVGM